MKYFIHDTNAFQDEKITQLFINFGYEGVGLFFTILEKIALQEKPVKTEVLKKQLFVGKRLEKCWEFMETIDLISSNNGETFNKQLLNFSETFKIKKEKNRKRIFEWRKNQEVAENVTCYESVRNTDKVNKSKVNKSKLNISHTIDEKNWKNDFEFYLSELRKVYKELISDSNYISEQEKFNPNIDIMLSLEKACTNFWATEAGWKYKKKSRSKEIDWKSTLTNAISLNKVYKSNGQTFNNNSKGKLAGTYKAAENLAREVEEKSRNFVSPLHKSQGIS